MEPHALQFKPHPPFIRDNAEAPAGDAHAVHLAARPPPPHHLQPKPVAGHPLAGALSLNAHAVEEAAAAEGHPLAGTLSIAAHAVEEATLASTLSLSAHAVEETAAEGHPLAGALSLGAHAVDDAGAAEEPGSHRLARSTSDDSVGAAAAEAPVIECSLPKSS